MRKYINIFFATFLISCLFLLVLGQAPSIKPIYTKLNDLLDVNVGTSPTNNHAVTWDTTTNKWIAEAPVPASHNHAASEITSGTLAHERGGLEADVSGYNGLVKITGGATSACTDATPYVGAALSTFAGKVELATSSETSLGTDMTRAVTPDGLAASIYGQKEYCLCIFESAVSVTTGDGGVAFTIPASMNGMDLYDVIASVHTQGIIDTTDIQIRRRRAGSDVDMLSTKVTIGAEYFASDETINASNDDVSTGDQIYIDVDAIHSGTAPLGLSVTLTFRKP